MPLGGPLRQMRKQNYAEGEGGGGGNRGRRDLMYLEFRAFPLLPGEKGNK